MWPEWLLKLLGKPVTYEDTLATMLPRPVDRPGIAAVWPGDPDPNTIGLYKQFLGRPGYLDMPSDSIYIRPDIHSNITPDISDRFLQQKDWPGTIPPSYVLGHEYGHAIFNHRTPATDYLIRNGPDGYTVVNGKVYQRTSSEGFARPFGEAMWLVRATEQGGTYGPEVIQALANRPPQTEQIFKWLLAQPAYQNHPLRGWARTTQQER